MGEPGSLGVEGNGSGAVAGNAKPDKMAKRMEKYCKTSLGCLDRSNCIRRTAVRIIEWPWFDRLILVLILANSVVLALTDYGALDAAGELSNASWRNRIVEDTELFFTTAFTIECALKIVCLGFFWIPGTYLRDGWNVLDFIVVVTGLLSVIPGMPNISAFRTVRVLRPLRSLTVVPEMQKLVMSLLSSIPALLNVVILLMFVFAIFGILGVQLWSGLLHARCRSTEYPMKMIAGCEDPISSTCRSAIAAAQAGTSNATWARCLSEPNDNDEWDQEVSPWATARDCFWPVVEDDTRVCTLGGAGQHECASGTFCGSDFDEFGNMRFSRASVMDRTTYFSKFNWGYTHFDHIAVALVTIFQVITMEGWTDVMYMVSDAHNAIAAAFYFVFLVLFGSFFLLNLTLAVIWDNFGGNKELDELILERRASDLADTMVAVHNAFRSAGELAASNRGELVAAADMDEDELRSRARAEVTEVLPPADSSPRSPPPVAAELTDKPRPNPTASPGQPGDVAVVDVGDTPTDSPRKAPVKWWYPAAPGACMYNIVKSRWFSVLIILLIVLNTIVLASDHHPMEQVTAARLEVINFVLTMLFTIEMLMKLYGLGVCEYARDAFNLFDCFIVVVSLIEMIVLPPGFLTAEEAGTGGGAISALRTFRLFRVFKLARDWRSLNILLKTIVKTLADIANFAVLLLLFMYIFSLVGMQFFANTFCFDPETGLPRPGPLVGSCDEPYERPRAHFDDLLWSFVTIFQVLTGENWNTVMYDGYRASGWTAVLYFIGLVVLGNFIVLNLFLAILLGNFEGMEALSSVEPDGPQESTVSKIMNKVLCRKNKRVVPVDSDGGDAGTPAPAKVGASAGPLRVRPKHSDEVEVKNLDAVDEDMKADVRQRAGDATTESGGSLRTVSSSHQIGGQEKPLLPPLGSGAGAGVGAGAGAVKGKVGRPPALDLDRLEEGRDGPAIKKSSSAKTPSAEAAKRPLVGRALCMFGPRNPIRRAVAWLVRMPTFDNVILLLIFISSVVLALDNPLLDPDSFLVAAIGILDIIFTVAFAVEMALKLVTFGFILNGPDSYVRSGWNQLDGIIVVVSILSLSASGNDSLRSLRSLRTMRALRPLRVISRRPGLRLVVNALFSSMKAIANVLFVCVLFFLIFGIVGVNYFKGAFYHCAGPDFDALSVTARGLVTNPEPWSQMTVPKQSIFSAHQADYQANYDTVAPSSKVVCGYLGASWETTVPQNFDHIFSAMGTLFEMSTTEGWVDVMYAGVDSTGIDQQPVRDQAWGWVFFFMAFMVVGSFFVMNLFVGVVIDNFNTMKDRLGGNYLLTDAQKEWVKTQERLMRNVPMARKMKEPKTPFRGWCYRVIMSPWFDGVIMACIILNTLVMAITFFGEPLQYTQTIEVVNYVFAIIFTLEAIIKLIALRMVYFKDSWNVFDFLIVLGTNIGLILKVAIGLNIGPIATVIRTFRVGRIFRLIKSAKSLRQLFQTLILTLPSLGNIGGLLFLLFFIYAVMGVQLFAKVRLQTWLNPHANFQSFWRAVITLMRSSTGESWNFIMYELADSTPNCRSEVAYNATVCGFNDFDGCIPIDGCGQGAAYLFFISFTLFVTFVFLNLFIAVILEGFSESGDEAEAKVTDDHLQQFYELWEKYDPAMSRFVHTSDMEKLVQELEEPLGFGADVHATPAMLHQRLAALELPVCAGNRVYLKDVVRALVGRHFNEEAIIPMDHKINQEWRKKFPSPRNMRSGFLLHNYYAALSIQNSYQAYKFRKSIDSRIDEKDTSKRVGRKSSASDDEDDD